MECTAAKRIKLSSSAQDPQIESILADHLTRPIGRKFVYVGTIANSKFISKIILELTQLLPITELNHLKRVRRNQIMLCSTDAIENFLREQTVGQSQVAHSINSFVSNSVKTPNNQWANRLLADTRQRQCLNQSSDSLEFPLDDLILACGACIEIRQFVARLYLQQHHLAADVLNEICQKIDIAEVPCESPILHWQYEEANAYWPCKFHRNNYWENLYNNCLFDANETAFHLRIMAVCKYLAIQLKSTAIGIAVDPRTTNVVAIGYDRTNLHPLMHCPMVLIDMVARSQNGGAWNAYWNDGSGENELFARISSATIAPSYTFNGVQSHIRRLIDDQFPDIRFGAEETKDAAAINIDPSVGSDTINGDNLAKYGPYLCTGYDIYLLREPCLMCGMSLVHSRARRIFFHETTSKGALCTMTKIHTEKALNHHYEVFRIH